MKWLSWGLDLIFSSIFSPIDYYKSQAGKEILDESVYDLKSLEIIIFSNNAVRPKLKISRNYQDPKKKTFPLSLHIID